MKYAPDTYAKAFLETKPASRQGGPDPKRFLEVVTKNGDFSRIEGIVAAIEKAAVHALGGRMVELEFARETPLSNKFKFTAKDHIRVRINPLLVAGVRITIDGEQELDGSFQRKINKLWPTK